MQITWRIKPVFNKRDLKKVDEYRQLTTAIMETEQVRASWLHLNSKGNYC
jgi:hypothetical protein